MCVCVCVCVCVYSHPLSLSFYYNSSVWFDKRQTSSWDRNPDILPQRYH